MNKLKGLIAVLLIAVLMSGALAGCKERKNKNAESGFPPNKVDKASGYSGNLKEHMKISIALWDIENSLSGARKDQFVAHLQDKLNITLEPVQITWDDYTQKIQIWAASSQLPDIFSIDAAGTQYYRTWLSQGLIKALPEDLSEYPYLKNYLDTPDIDTLKENGKLYCVPRRLYDSLDYCAHDRNVFYRWDLAQKAGITREPETWDEFKAMLEAIVDKDPEGNGIGGLTAVNLKQIGGFFWLYSNPAAASDGSGSDFKWIKEDGRYIPAVFSKKSIPALKNIRDMFERGLVDEDISMVKGNQAYESFLSGKAAAILLVGYDNFSARICRPWKRMYPQKKILDNVKRLTYLPSTDGKTYHCVFRTFWSESYFNGKISAEKMDRIMRLYDYMLQPDTKEFYRFGIKGIDYKKEGENIIPVTSLEELRKKQPSMDVLYSLVEYDNQFLYSPNNRSFDPEIKKAAISDLEYARNHTLIPEYEARLTDLSTPAKDKLSVFDYDLLLKVMTGREPVEKMWEDILEEYEGKGLGRMIQEVNQKAEELGIG